MYIYQRPVSSSPPELHSECPDTAKLSCNLNYELNAQVTKEDLAAHVRQRLEAEQLEKERRWREKEESHLHTVIRVARDKDIKTQIGQDIYFDLVDHEKACLLRQHFRRLVNAACNQYEDDSPFLLTVSST